MSGTVSYIRLRGNIVGANPAVSKDTLRMIEQESPVMGNIVKYEVDFGKQVKEANVYAEVWEKGGTTDCCSWGRDNTGSYGI